MNYKQLKAIFIEAGHWAWDPGACSNWTTERKEVLEIVYETLIYFKQIPEFKWIKLFQITEELSLENKISYINKLCKQYWYTANNSILVSVHTNAGGKWIASRIEWWFYKNNPESKKLSDNIINAVSWLTNISLWKSIDESQNRYWKLWIIHDTMPLACLIECWFLDTINDAKILKNDKTDNLFSQWIMRGIKWYLWLK